MTATTETSAYTLVEWLESGSEEKKYEAALQLRFLAAKVSNKLAIRRAGGIKAVLELLDAGPDSALTTVAAETLSCLAAEDPHNREEIRRCGGIQRLVKLLKAGPDAECTHRALLALRILTDREADRLTILKAGGIPLLVRLLDAGPDSEVTEYAAAALGNLAAGGHELKDAIRGAGAIHPLVELLRDHPDEIAAELAAVALRNLALQNPINRQAILTAGGLQPLLHLLSMGQEKLVYPMQCEVVYNEYGGGHMTRRFETGLCCFDPRRGELCVAVRIESSVLGCFTGPRKQGSPRDRSAERYSLLRKLKLAEPDARTLELVFTVADREGAQMVSEAANPMKNRDRRLERVLISPCPATELKGAIMRMLTRTHLEREFKLGKQTGRLGSMGSLTSAIGLARTPSMARYARAIAV